MRYGQSERRLTKIVTTIGRLHGPSYAKMLRRFNEAGMNVARINMSHCDADYAKEREILSYSRELGLPDRGTRMATLGDLQGPKIRLGHIGKGTAELETGAEVLVREADSSDDPAVLPIPAPLAGAVMRGIAGRISGSGESVRLLLGDGEVALAVEMPRNNEAKATVISGGEIRSRMGFTPKEADIDLDPFTDKDRKDLAFLLEEGVHWVAVSFVRTAENLRRIRYYIKDTLGVERHVPLIAKIETAAAVQNIQAIVNESDGIMVARGDLGLQIDLEDVPQVQKRLTWMCRLAAKPVIIATQMLESMTFNPEPTRAEATDVFNAILDGCDAVMLSGETSRGDHPELAIEVMNRIAVKAEVWQESNRLGSELDHLRIDLYEHYTHDTDGHMRQIDDEVSMAVAKLADGIGSKFIATITTTGASARRIARFRSRVPAVASGSDVRVMRELLLSYGVQPVVIGESGDTDHDGRVAALSRKLCGLGWLKKNDVMVVAYSHDAWHRGGTNMVHVHVVP